MQLSTGVVDMEESMGHDVGKHFWRMITFWQSFLPWSEVVFIELQMLYAWGNGGKWVKYACLHDWNRVSVFPIDRFSNCWFSSMWMQSSRHQAWAPCREESYRLHECKLHRGINVIRALSNWIWKEVHWLSILCNSLQICVHCCVHRKWLAHVPKRGFMPIIVAVTFLKCENQVNRASRFGKHCDNCVYSD